MSASVVGTLMALSAALAWGSGDFGGGMATRRHGPFVVLVVAGATGMVGLAFAALVAERSMPPFTSVVAGAVAGVSGTLGMAALYRGLAHGAAAVVAPLAAVIGVAVPVLVAAWVEGAPSGSQGLGLVVGTGGIMLITGAIGGRHRAPRADVIMGILAGLGFGGFFVFMGRIEAGSLWVPLLVARATTLLLGWGLMGIRGERLPAIRRAGPAAAAGVLDTAGNVCYVVATQLTRLDAAAVLGAMAPAVTVVLGWLFRREAVTKLQWGGVALCVSAVALIGAG